MSIPADPSSSGNENAVVVPWNSREREQTVTMAEAGIRQLVAQFAKGDRYARRDLSGCGNLIQKKLKAMVVL